MKRLPRRLDHGEEATLVEHLERAARSASSSASARSRVGFIVTYVFHGQLLALAEPAAPPRTRKPITLGVARAVPHRRCSSASSPASCSRCRSLLWQVWAFLAPAFDEQHAARASSASSLFATRACSPAASLFGYFVALPAAVTS